MSEENNENIENQAPKKRMVFSRKTKLMGAVIILVLFIAGGFYFFSKSKSLKNTQNAVAQNEVANLITAVGKLMELPIGETPTVATVKDKEKLKDQVFFANAQNGDQLLAYSKAMKAILYRPSTNKIIEVMPLVINDTTTKQQTNTQLVPTGLKVAYYNGTATIGLGGIAEEAVKKIYPDSKTSAMTKAKKRDYKETLVVDLTGKNETEVAIIAKLLNGKVGTMPSEETKPDADILIIAGQ